MEINNKELLKRWEEEIKTEISTLKETPKLRVIVAKDYSQTSVSYIKNKKKTCDNLGIELEVIEIEWKDKTSEQLLEELTRQMVEAENYDIPVIVQLPFPELTEQEIADIIPAHLDVDGFTEIQKGKLFNGDKGALVPCTALGVMKMLKYIHGEDLSGMTIAIANRSNLIGKPLCLLALQENMTPTIIHTKTREDQRNTALAFSDIVVTGCGQRKIFSWKTFALFERHGDTLVKTIIDCSMNKVDGIKGVGDCDKEDILEELPSINIVSGYGHTGPFTCMALAYNVVQTYKNKLKKEKRND